MKCRKCSQRAVINMRQHKLALCKDHFQNWVLEQTERNICKYRMFDHNDNVLVAVSGGKDSLALWHVLHSLGYKTGGLYINLGIKGNIQYSNQSQLFVEEFAVKNNLQLHFFNLSNELHSTLPEISQMSKRNKTKPCATCGLIKRHTMNKIASQYGYNILVTGHNLDDEVAVLYNNTLSWQIDFLRRQAPVLPAIDGLVRKAKPFCRFYERETAAYAILNEIPFMEEECPYATGSTTLQMKDVLNQLEHDHAGTKLSFYLKFLKAKPVLFPQVGSDLVPVDDLFRCDICSQPTTKKGICAFCRLQLEIQEKKVLYEKGAG